MASIVEVANMALINIGGQQISSLSENNKSARIISQLWNIIRNIVLEAHPWTFATSVRDLAQLAAPPMTRWQYAYQLPTDYLKDIRIGEPENDLDYEIVGKALHTDEAAVTLTYIYRCENVGVWSGHFCATFAYRLAQDIAIPLAGAEKGRAIKREMRSEYLVALHDAQAVNDSQGNDRDIKPRQRWTEARK